MNPNLFRAIASVLLSGATGLFVIHCSSGWQAWLFVIAVSLWLGNNAIRNDD